MASTQGQILASASLKPSPKSLFRGERFQDADFGTDARFPDQPRMLRLQAHGLAGSRLHTRFQIAACDDQARKADFMKRGKGRVTRSAPTIP